MFSFLAGSEIDEANSITKEAVVPQPCIYVQDCTHSSEDLYLWTLLRCIFYFFTHKKIRYNCLKCLKMYLTRALFPKPTLLVTARGGTVFWSYLIFFFPNAENSRWKWLKTRFPRTIFHALQLSPSYCTVWNEVTSSGKCPSHDSEYFQNLIWFTTWFFLFLQLWHASSLSTQQGS